MARVLIVEDEPNMRKCNLRMLLAEWERNAIVQTLGKTKGGKAETARRLGLRKVTSLTNLHNMGFPPGRAMRTNHEPK